MDTPIPRSYWVIDGLLLAGEYPGSRLDADARPKLQAFIDAGIRAFFDLTEQREPLSPYDDLLRELAQSKGIEIAYDRVPIRDGTVPRSHADLHTLLARISVNVAAGTPSYVHCWGGHGRTGTVIGCWLVQHEAMGGNAALERIAALRRGTPDEGRPSPETAEQSELVRAWPEASRKMLARHPTARRRAL